MIRTREGTEESHQVRPSVQSKVASIPVGADVAFLLDEMEKIVDVTFESVEAIRQASALSQKKSPLKGNLSHVDGVVVTPLIKNTIVIRVIGGIEQSYQARPSTQERLGSLARGDAATLLVDGQNKVTDVAFVPNGHR